MDETVENNRENFTTIIKITHNKFDLCENGMLSTERHERQMKLRTELTERREKNIYIINCLTNSSGDNQNPTEKEK